MLTILAGVATWEREIMLERQREGIAQAKALGKNKGRPQSIDRAQIREADLGRRQQLYRRYRPTGRSSNRGGWFMILPQSGGCLCRALLYEIPRAPIVVYTCHCTDCQHLTGSAFSMALDGPRKSAIITVPDRKQLQRQREQQQMAKADDRPRGHGRGARVLRPHDPPRRRAAASEEAGRLIA